MVNTIETEHVVIRWISVSEMENNVYLITAKETGAQVLIDAADDIEAGRLVVPFGPSLTLTPAYYLVTAPGRSGRPEIQAFRDWLLAEVADFQARPDRPGT